MKKCSTEVGSAAPQKRRKISVVFYLRQATVSVTRLRTFVDRKISGQYLSEQSLFRRKTKRTNEKIPNAVIVLFLTNPISSTTKKASERLVFFVVPKSLRKYCLTFEIER